MIRHITDRVTPAFAALAVCAFASPCAADDRSARDPFSSVMRLHYRAAVVAGESSLALGSFNAFGNGLFVAASAQTFSSVTTSPRLADRVPFTSWEAALNIGRAFAPSDPIGKVAGWVVRAGWMTGQHAIGSGGLQWNISNTPGVANAPFRWKSFVQVFAKANAGDLGVVDLYHWYQLPLPGTTAFLRGSNAFYVPGRGPGPVVLVQDLIFPAYRSIEIYAEHYYQNVAAFNRSRGSQFLLGVRLSVPMPTGRSP
jgi:hypothetical protein